MLNVKPETLTQMDDKELETRRAEAEKLDRRAKKQFSIMGLISWAVGAAAIGGALAFFGLPLMAIVLPVAAAIAVVPPAACFAATFYTTAELKRITDAIKERKEPKRKIEVIFEDGTKSVITTASSPTALGSSFAAKAPPSASVDGLPTVPEAAAPNKPMLLLPLLPPPKTA